MVSGECCQILFPHEFPPFDQDTEEEEFGRLLGSAEAPQGALVLAEERTGAVRGRWVNQGVVQDEYHDFVRAGRPSSVSPDGHAWPPFAPTCEALIASPICPTREPRGTGGLDMSADLAARVDPKDLAATPDPIPARVKLR